jgi:flagellar basal body-associated protein FliL
MFSAKFQHIARNFFGRSLTLLVLCLLGMTLLTGCTLPWRHHKSTNANTLAAHAPRPTTAQLLAALQKSFRVVKSFHVTLQVQNAGTPVQDAIQIHSADGDVAMPDKVKAQATVMMSGQSLTVNLISVGGNQFITDPVTGQWRIVKGMLDPRTLTNPNTGLISVVGKLKNVSQPASYVVGNNPCWGITGQLDAKDLAFFTGGGVPAGTLLKTTACMGKGDSLPYYVGVVGEAAAGDTPQTTRIFTMSNYNENITITAPQI